MSGKNDRLIWIDDNVCSCKEAIAVISGDTRTLFDEKKLDPITEGSYSVAPWGVDNVLPQRIMSKIDAAEIVGTNANFNRDVAYGLGPLLVEKVRDKTTKKIVDIREVTGGEAFEWYEANNVPHLLSEILTDISYFGNAFPVLIAGSKKGGKRWVEGIRHREAMFSRWGLDGKKLINKHLYCSGWDEKPNDSDIQASEVIDEYNAVDSIKTFLDNKNIVRMCYPIYIPSPGRPYYSYPNWWSVFRSGWYDNIVSIPALKKAILKYNLGVKHIIYISEEYFNDKERLLKIQANDFDAKRKLREDTVEEISEILAGSENAGKAITSLKKMFPSANGVTIDKYIEIETIKNDISGGEYLTDYETGANIISYAMDVHPALIGATPGKNSNSLSGSNIREIFIMKQSLSKWKVALALEWFKAVRKINGWNDNYDIIVRDNLFTTLDQNKSGQIETANTFAQ